MLVVSKNPKMPLASINAAAAAVRLHETNERGREEKRRAVWMAKDSRIIATNMYDVYAVCLCLFFHG